MDFLFNITRCIAESDSIGEEYAYCRKYTREMFNNGEKHIQPQEYKERGMKDYYDSYLYECSADIYELYLEQIGVIEKST